MTTRHYTRFEGYNNFLGQSKFGKSSQVLGNINVYNCKPHEGGSYKDVETRAGLIKGSRNAKGLEVSRRMVINGWGVFSQNAM